MAFWRSVTAAAHAAKASEDVDPCFQALYMDGVCSLNGSLLSYSAAFAAGVYRVPVVFSNYGRARDD